MNKISRLLLSLSFITISIVSFSNNFKENESTTDINKIKTAKVFNFNSENKALEKNDKKGDVKNWWNQLAYKKSPNDFSNSFIQNQKSDWTNSSDPKITPGWGNINSSTETNDPLDFIWYSPKKIQNKYDNQSANKPDQNSEYNGNFNGGREFLFGSNFGLFNSIGYRVSSLNAANKPSYGYSYKINMGGIDSEATANFQLNSSGGESSIPVNDHGTKDFTNAYKKDFDNNLWNREFLTPPVQPAKGSTTKPSPSTLLNGNTIRERTITQKNNNITYKIVTFVTYTGSGETGSDNIITEYTESGDPKNSDNNCLHLINDKLHNYQTTNTDGTKDWKNDGHLFINQLLNKAPDETSDKAYINYLKYGYFPVKIDSASNSNTTPYYEPVESRSEMVNNNPNSISEIISSPLNKDNTDDNKNGTNLLDYNENIYKKWGKNIQGDVNVTDSLSDIKNTSPIAERKYLLTTDPKNSVFNNLPKKYYYYHYLTVRGPSKNSSISKDGSVDNYHSYSPYVMYSAAIGGKTDKTFNTLQNNKKIFYSLDNSSVSEIPENGTNGKSYVQNSSNIQYKHSNSDPNSIINKLQKFDFQTAPFTLPSYGIALIVIGVLILLWLPSQHVFKKKQIKKWKASKSGVKGYEGDDYELINTNVRTSHEEKIKDYLTNKEPSLIKKIIKKIFKR